MATEINQLYARTIKRRIIKFPNQLANEYRFDCWQANISVLKTVDRVTSGKFFWDTKRRLIAFENASDLTAFLLAFSSTTPKRRWLAEELLNHVKKRKIR